MPPLRHWAALLLSIVSVAALGLLVRSVSATTGELTFPLDDAYIHLALAQNLVRSGTWGVNPGEFASASSSPLWTALLAVPFGGGSLWLPLALNAIAMVGALFAASVLLRDAHPAVRLVTLLAFAVATPLPFLAGLGMEHMLHVAMVLALIVAIEAAANRTALETAPPILAHPAIVALLAGAAVLTRYETVFLLGGLTLAFGRTVARTPHVLGESSRFRPRTAAGAVLAAAWAGAGVAVTSFGLWSVANGSAFLPNPVLKKAWAGRDWLAGLEEVWRDGTSLLAPMLAVAIALGFRAGARDRRRAVVFLVAAGGQLVFGRIGWLHRYEAWLVALAVLVLVPILAELIRRGPRVVFLGLLALAAPPLGARTQAAFDEYVPAARSTHDTNVAPARWLAATQAGRPVAVHDLGAMALYARTPTVDLAGLGSDEIARLLRQGRLSPETLAPILAAHDVDVAIAGEHWTADARPPAFAPVARIVVPFPAFPGTFDTVVWAADPTRADEVRRSLATVAWAPRVNVVLSTDVPVELGAAAITGSAVAVEPQGLSFYSNGTATFALPATGDLRVYLAGTEGQGRLPRVHLEISGHDVEVEAPDAGVVVRPGVVTAGDTLIVRFTDDGAGPGDRNVTLRSVHVRP